SGARYTAVAFDRLSSIRALVLTDDPGTSLGADRIRVRIVHAASGVGKVDFWALPSASAPALVDDDVDFGSFGAYFDLAVGGYAIGTDLDNDAPPELVFDRPSLAAGTIATIFAVADTAGKVTLISETEDGATITIEPRMMMSPPPAPTPAH